MRIGAFLLAAVTAAVASGALAEEPACPPEWSETLCRSGQAKPGYQPPPAGAFAPFAPPTTAADMGQAGPQAPPRRPPDPFLLPPAVPFLPPAIALDPLGGGCLYDPGCAVAGQVVSQYRWYVDQCRAGRRLACERLRTERDRFLVSPEPWRRRP
jgi:hypothetical protein